MDIRPLHTEDDYRAALAEVSALVDLDPEPGTSEGDRLEVLSILVEHYESLMETAHLLRSPANVTDLERSIAQLQARKINPAPESVEAMKPATDRLPRDASVAREAATRLADLGGTQPGIEGAPRRRFGTLAGQVGMSADFDAPLKIDEAAIDRAARDNPDVPRSFVADTLQGRAEACAGKTKPFRPKGKRDDK